LNCEFAQTTVHGYFDGELDAVRSAEFERHLETCAECQAKLQEIESLHERLQRSNLFEPASTQLREKINHQIAPQNARGRPVERERIVFIPAFGALAAVAALLVLAFFVLQARNQSSHITAELIDAHVRSLQPGHLTDVLSSDQHTVKPWFDGKLEFIPPVSDFSQQGFPLIGGRLDIIDGHSVATLVYGRRKHFINLFVWPYGEKDINPSGSGSHDGFNWLAWRSGEMQFCLISDASVTDLRELSELLGK
jgi:anti-sigma factor RsiW